MVNKCAVVNCRTGYKTQKSESCSLFANKTVFSFPKDTNLEEKWIKFIKRKNWKPSKRSVCIPSSIKPKLPSFQKPPTEQNSTIPDKIYTFQEMDKIKNIDMLHESNSPNEFNSTPFIESINIDNNLHVNLHYKSCPLPFP
ncbi:uncharacterized protein LOC136089526 [Hydra vulgaris]|uniref:Uncharacterized protein LOC136089526 n=1 Tax=Hydra vulgaris TaxID=6087 RepID=A0ABM4DBB2_HYDVU